MDELIATIQSGVAAAASDEARAAGAQACRTVLAVLEAKPGEPLAPPMDHGNPIQAVVSALRGMPPEQLLDLAIARLKAALPAGTEVQPIAPLKIPFLPVLATGGRP